MKLYATTTSERASKGQGGNDYLDIKITDEKENLIMSIYLLPRDKTGRYAIELRANLDIAQQIEADIQDIIEDSIKLEQKGKSQKGEFEKDLMEIKELENKLKYDL